MDRDYSIILSGSFKVMYRTDAGNEDEALDNAYELLADIEEDYGVSFEVEVEEIW